MATAPQNQALTVMKENIGRINDRYDGYSQDLTATLHEILALESDRPHNISQRTTRAITALGELLVQNDGNIE